MSGEEAIAAAMPPQTEPSAPPADSPPAASPAAATDLRGQLIARFAQWLDQVLVEEPPPRGLPEELLNEAAALVAGNQPAASTDLYSLFAALTGLTGEIRLQGRAFKQLADLLTPLAPTPALLEQLRQAQIELAVAMQDLLASQTDDSDALPVETKQICAVMIDLYDRLQRGLQTCDEGIAAIQARGQRGRLRQWLSAGDASAAAIASVQAIRQASALALARLQAALQEWGVQRIGRVGEAFDPERMSAVETRPAGENPPGTVLAVNRSGYALNGVIKATAQVTVSQAEI